MNKFNSLTNKHNFIFLILIFGYRSINLYTLSKAKMQQRLGWGKRTKETVHGGQRVEREKVVGVQNGHFWFGEQRRRELEIDDGKNII
jgi:hypothetical protein